MSWNLRAWWRADRSYTRGSRLLRAGQPGEAAKAFAEVIALFPAHSRAYLQQAKALAAAGRPSEALRACKRAAELSPKSHAPLLFQGQIEYDAGHLEEARKAFQAAAKLAPENQMVQAYLGLTLLAGGKLEQGTKLLQEHLLYGYDALEARLLTLVEQYLWEHRDQAQSLEDQLTTDEGGRDDRPAGFGLRLASAVRCLVAWPLAAIRGRKGLLKLRAEEAVTLREWDRVIAALQEAETLGANAEDSALSLGMAYLEARKPVAAAEQFLRLSAEVRADPQVAMMVGAAFYDAGRYEDAREPLGLAAEHYTRDFLPAYFRGLCDIALGQPQTATRWFLLAVDRLNPQLTQKRFEELGRVRGLKS
jgi:tetratricopeptide (TPR) repeat protein